MFPYKKISLYLLLPLLVISCRKPSGANWDVDLIFPVVNSQLNVRNFLPDTLYSADNTGLLHLILNREVASLKLDSLLKLPNTTIVKSFTLNFPVTINPGVPIDIFPPSELQFDIGNDIKLVKIEVRTGLLNVKFSNSVNEPVDLAYLLPSITKDGKPLLISETVPPGNHSLIKTYDLAGYHFNLRGLSGNKVNTISQSYTVTLNAAAQPVTINPGDGPSVELSYSEITPQYVEGYFGQQSIDMPAETVDFGLIDNFKATDFLLSDVKMDFKILNQFGADFRASLSGITSVNSTNQNTVVLQSAQLSVIHIDWPKRVFNTVTPSEKILSFNTSNSNIAPFISNLPDKISYSGKVLLNPLPEKVVGYGNYAYYNTGISIVADIDIPMRFTADRFQLRSFAETDFSNVEQLNHANSGNFIVTAANGYPFTASLQVYMLDENRAVIDSLFVPGANHIRAGQLNAQNDVTAPVTSILMIPLNREKIMNLQRCKAMRIEPTFLMPPNPPDIKIMEHYEFDVNVVAELNYNVGIRR